MRFNEKDMVEAEPWVATSIYFFAGAFQFQRQLFRFQLKSYYDLTFRCLSRRPGGDWFPEFKKSSKTFLSVPLSLDRVRFSQIFRGVRNLFLHIEFQ